MLDRYKKNTSPGVNVSRVVKDVLMALGAIILIVVCWPFYTVPTGSRGVITQFGKIIGIEGEGLAILPPWQRLNNFNIRAEAARIDKAEGATSDTQPVETSLVIRYSVLPDKVAEVYEKYSHDGDLSDYIQSGGKEIFKAVTARYTAPALIEQRAKVSADIAAALATKIEKYGAQVINIDMTQFSFSKTYMDAINAKVTQEQLRLGAENKLKTVEAEQKQKVVIAEAEAGAVKAAADGQAYKTVTEAKATASQIQMEGEARAKAMDAQAQALSRNPALVELRKAEAWDGKLPVNMYGSAPVPFMNVGK